MKIRNFVLLAILASWTGLAMGQQLTGNATKIDAPAAKTAPAGKHEPSARPPVVRSRPKTLDADQAYKANCSRCHVAPRKFSERKMSAIMLHMRVRANLTEQETKAILDYLTR